MSAYYLNCLAQLISWLTWLSELPGLLSTCIQCLKDAIRPTLRQIKSRGIHFLKAFGLLINPTTGDNALRKGRYLPPTTTGVVTQL
jgi:hypothetical protein